MSNKICAAQSLQNDEQTFFNFSGNIFLAPVRNQPPPPPPGYQMVQPLQKF